MRVRRLTDDTVVTKVTEGDRLVAGFGTGHELGEADLVTQKGIKPSAEKTARRLLDIRLLLIIRCFISRVLA